MLRMIAPFAAVLWQHRELLWQFTQRNVELRHKGSHLGLVWSFLNPLLMLGLYVMVFGYIFGGRFGVLADESRAEYALGVFLGLTIFHFLSEILGLAPTLIVGNPNFVKKVVFPLEILPAAAVGAALFHMLISLGLVLIGLAIFGVQFTFNLCWIPIILLPIILLGLGFAWFFAAIGVFFRDISQVIQFISMVLMWASGIFYSADKYPAAWTYLRLNPILHGIDMIRDVTLWHRPLPYIHLLYLYLCGFGVCYLGYLAFRRTKPAFADVL